MSGIPAPIELVTAWRVVLPLRADFVSAQARLRQRELVLLALGSGGHTGWGEAAPVPGHTTERIEQVWEQILACGQELIGWEPQPLGGLLGAAVAQALADLDAKRSGRPLWQVHGGKRSATAGAAVGINHNGDPDRRLIQSASTARYRFAKLKVTRFTNADRLATLVSAYPRMRFGVDANGALSPKDDELLVRLDELGFEFIEQPGPADDLDWHVALRERMRTPISLDESADSPESVRRIIASGAADIVNLKVGRFGPETTLALADEAAAAGLQARLGGLIESGIGRAHSVALAGHPHFSMVGDIAGSDRYFEDDLVRPQWHVTDGTITVPDRPGIGVDVDDAAVAAHATASIRFP